jgi:hypothetical protein
VEDFVPPYANFWRLGPLCVCGVQFSRRDGSAVA